MEQELEVEVVPLTEVPAEADFETEEEWPLVLVVDGDTILADTRAEVLARSGLAVMKAYDGITALELARLNPPDLLLSNVMLRGMTGIDLAMALDKRAACRVLLLSTEQPHLANALTAGHDFASISMPLHPSELLKRVFACLDWQPRRVKVPSLAGQGSIAMRAQMMTPVAC